MRCHTFMIELESGEIVTKEVNAPDIKLANRALTGWLRVNKLNSIRVGCIPPIEEYAAFLEKGAAQKDYRRFYTGVNYDWSVEMEHALWAYSNAAYRAWALEF